MYILKSYYETKASFYIAVCDITECGVWVDEWYNIKLKQLYFY